MFKKVKSLLVAGLLVLGSAVPAFADDTYDLVVKNYSEVMSEYGEVSQGATMQERIIAADKGISESAWNATVNAVNSNTEDYLGMQLIDTPGGNGNFLVFYDVNNDNVYGTDETAIETILISYAEESKAKGAISIQPGTGDALAVGAVAGVVALGGVLVVVNKKRK